MMPVSELVRVAASLRDDGSSPLAEAAGAPYGLVTTRFVRSSASHVFFAGRLGDLEDDLDQVLRMHPEGEGYAAEVVPRVSGWPLEIEEMTEDQVTRWGGAVAEFHAGPADPLAPDWFTDVLVPAAAALDLPKLDAVVARIGALPRTESTWGRTHGDPQPDNLVWRDGTTPVLVDLDDVGRSWYGADVVFALRDLPPSDPRAGLFLEGYGGRRDLLRAAWHDFEAAHDGVMAARLTSVVAEPVDAAWPAWATALHDRVARIRADILANLT